MIAELIDMLLFWMSMGFLLTGLLIMGGLVGGKDHYSLGMLSGFMMWLAIFLFVVNLPANFIL